MADPVFLTPPLQYSYTSKSWGSIGVPAGYDAAAAYPPPVTDVTPTGGSGGSGGSGGGGGTPTASPPARLWANGLK